VPAAPVAVHHLELTVTDLDRSEAWYSSVLGFEKVGGMDASDHSVVLLRAGALLVGLVGHTATPGSDAFDERRIGLDHVGFQVPTPDDVEAWAAHLNAHGIAHSGVKDGALEGTRVVIFRDPDNIQLEFYYAP
jgi:catechol 2,3-dioxygenase-like lactoylglutathione lyase family enzyme